MKFWYYCWFVGLFMLLSFNKWLGLFHVEIYGVWAVWVQFDKSGSLKIMFIKGKAELQIQWAVDCAGNKWNTTPVRMRTCVQIPGNNLIGWEDNLAYVGNTLTFQVRIKLSGD